MIRLLVSAGASLDSENKENKSAEDVSKGAPEQATPSKHLEYRQAVNLGLLDKVRREVDAQAKQASQNTQALLEQQRTRMEADFARKLAVEIQAAAVRSEAIVKKLVEASELKSEEKLQNHLKAHEAKTQALQRTMSAGLAEAKSSFEDTLQKQAKSFENKLQKQALEVSEALQQQAKFFEKRLAAADGLAEKNQAITKDLASLKVDVEERIKAVEAKCERLTATQQQQSVSSAALSTDTQRQVQAMMSKLQNEVTSIQVSLKKLSTENLMMKVGILGNQVKKLKKDQLLVATKVDDLAEEGLDRQKRAIWNLQSHQSELLKVEEDLRAKIATCVARLDVFASAVAHQQGIASMTTKLEGDIGSMEGEINQLSLQVAGVIEDVQRSRVQATGVMCIDDEPPFTAKSNNLQLNVVKQGATPIPETPQLEIARMQRDLIQARMMRELMTDADNSIEDRRKMRQALFQKLQHG